MNQMNRIKATFAGLGVATLLGGSALAGDGKIVIDDKAPVAEPEPWTVCNLFDYSTLYESDSGLINEISLIGRYHGQWHATDSNQGSDDYWDHRRARFGTEIVFLENFTFEGQFNLDFDGDEERFFESVEDLFIAWEPNDDTYVVIGKVKPKITREYSTSSKRIKTLERSQLVNQTVPDKIGGIQVGYQFNDKTHLEIGGYTGVNSSDWALPEFTGSGALSLRLAYDITENTEFRFDYFYADGAGEDNAVEDYDNIFSWNTASNWGDLSLVTDLIYATGVDDNRNSDAFSLVIMPYYALTEKLEAVFRYTYSTSDGAEGIRLQSRYERGGDAAPLNTRGDNYNAFYLGLNYYICGDKLKLMNGVEYATLDAPKGADWDGWTYFAGVRLYF